MIDQDAVGKAGSAREAATWRDYVVLARPGYWVKHVFILPGIVLAALLRNHNPLDDLGSILLGLVSAALLASANYVLNEWLDAESDAFHPTKSHRPAVTKRLSPAVVWIEYLGLATVGLVLAATVSTLLAVVSTVFLASGWVYNVRPVRTKDLLYVDVLTESVNNPIRLTLGWAMLETSTLPPGSLLGGYWMGGAFLMTIKRLAEYRAAAASGALEVLGRYRQSFRSYTETSLLISALLYSMLSGFFIAVFFVKYRIEYLLALPVLAALFGVYLHVGLKRQSTAQTPERLIRETGLVVVTLVLVVTLIVLTVVDLPILDRLTDPHYIELPFGA